MYTRLVHMRFFQTLNSTPHQTLTTTVAVYRTVNTAVMQGGMLAFHYDKITNIWTSLIEEG